jgi:hypothetical protein
MLLVTLALYALAQDAPDPRDIPPTRPPPVTVEAMDAVTYQPMQIEVGEKQWSTKDDAADRERAEGDADFVLRAFRALLCRVPSEAEVQEKSRPLTQGILSRSEMIMLFRFSEEYALPRRWTSSFGMQ